MEGSPVERPSDTLTIDVEGDGTGTVVIAANGVIDLVTHAALEQAAANCLDSGQPRVILDLSGVSLCDSTGLSALIRLHRRAERSAERYGETELRLAGVQPQVRRVLEITDLTRLLHIYDTVAEARA